MKRRILIVTLLMLSYLLLFLLQGCSEADTLSDESPNEIVIEGTPSWENGIERLIQTKCGVCHSIPLSEVAPKSTPKMMDFSLKESQEGVIGADILYRRGWIELGILEENVGKVRKMPPKFATPLTMQEIKALKAWVKLEKSK